ncbi:hypothetical protein PIB30_058920, partial [Stylosanthes scabra]|nr:hypothetical protein [Stylosanthes scabra]
MQEVQFEKKQKKREVEKKKKCRAEDGRGILENTQECKQKRDKRGSRAFRKRKEEVKRNDKVSTFNSQALFNTLRESKKGQ